MLFMALATRISAALADRVGRRPVLLISAVAAAAVGLVMPALLAQGPAGVRLPLARAWRDRADLGAPRGAAAGTVPDRGAPYRRGERLQFSAGFSTPRSRLRWREYSRRAAASVGRILHRRRRDQLPRHPQHGRNALIAALTLEARHGWSRSITAPELGGSRRLAGFPAPSSFEALALQERLRALRGDVDHSA
jgi:hypothetical protein